MTPPSRSEIDRLGRRLRETGQITDTDRTLYERYRDQFLLSLTAIEDEVTRISADIEGAAVSSRLKRLESLVDKLQRKPIRLSSLHDIAGCRLVVPTLGDVRRLQPIILDELDIIRFHDYHEGRQDGYRAWHFIIRGPNDHRVELQLRTDLQDIWANISEWLAFRLDYAIKTGGGPSDVRRRLRILSAWGWMIDNQRISIEEQIHNIDEISRFIASDLTARAQREPIDDVLDRLSRTLDPGQRYPRTEIEAFVRIVRQLSEHVESE